MVLSPVEAITSPEYKRVYKSTKGSFWPFELARLGTQGATAGGMGATVGYDDYIIKGR